jgi:hypothetical protein
MTVYPAIFLLGFQTYFRRELTNEISRLDEAERK